MKRREKYVAFYNRGDERDPYKRRGMSMPKPWKGGMGDGVDIQKFCYQVWETLGRQLDSLPGTIQLVDRQALAGIVEYVYLVQNSRPDSMDIVADEFLTCITNTIMEENGNGFAVSRLMFVRTTSPENAYSHPFSSRLNLSTGLWEFGTTVGLVRIPEKTIKQVSLKDAVLRQPPPEEPVLGKGSICDTKWEMRYITETDKAVLVRDWIDESQERWIPKSQMSDTPQTQSNGKYRKYRMTAEGNDTGVIFYTPRWLYYKAGREFKTQIEMARRQEAALVGLRREAAKQTYSAMFNDSRAMFDDSVKFRTDAPWTIRIYDILDEAKSKVNFDDFPDKPSRATKTAGQQVTVVKVVGKRKLDI